MTDIGNMGRFPFPLDEFTNDLTDLVDVSMETTFYSGHYTIIKFMERRAKLQKFYFSIVSNQFTENIVEILSERFKNEWRIQEFKDIYHGLCFER